MNKTFLSAALMAGVGIAAFAPQAANASDGTINFTGSISASTCTVSANGGSAVALPNVSTSALSTVGETAAATPFSIALTGCTGLNTGSVGVYFEPGASTLADGNLKNTSVGGSNVEIQLLNGTQGVMTLNSTSGSQNGTTAAVTGTSTSATLNYYAQYVAATAAATTGSVASSVTFSVIYP